MSTSDTQAIKCKSEFSSIFVFLHSKNNHLTKVIFFGGVFSDPFQDGIFGVNNDKEIIGFLIYVSTLVFLFESLFLTGTPDLAKKSSWKNNSKKPISIITSRSLWKPCYWVFNITGASGVCLLFKNSPLFFIRLYNARNYK